MHRLSSKILIIIIFVLIYYLRFEIIDLIDDISTIKNKFILVFIISILFFMPFFSTFLILINSMIFYQYGFYISFILLIFSSAVTFLLIKKKKKKKVINLKLRNNLKNFYKKGSELYISDYGIFFMRLLIPPFVHNISYSFIDKIKFKNFLIMISLAELPIVYSISVIGKSIKNFDHIKNSSLNILYEPSFYLPVIFLTLVIFLVKLLNKKNMNN